MKPESFDANGIANAAYAVICPLTETVIEHGANVSCNGHHWAQKAVEALMAYLRLDTDLLSDHVRRCLEVKDELQARRRDDEEKVE